MFAQRSLLQRADCLLPSITALGGSFKILLKRRSPSIRSSSFFHFFLHSCGTSTSFEGYISLSLHKYTSSPALPKMGANKNHVWCKSLHSSSHWSNRQRRRTQLLLCRRTICTSWQSIGKPQRRFSIRMTGRLASVLLTKMLMARACSKASKLRVRRLSRRIETAIQKRHSGS